MSIITTVYVPEGIAMAADSRLTWTRNNNGVTEIFTGSDNSQKLFLLHKIPVGISTCGNANICGQTIPDFIRLFEIKIIDSNDTIITVGNKLCSYLKQLGCNDTVFFISGYYQDVPYVFRVSSTIPIRYNFNTDTGEIEYGACWDGELEAISKITNSQPKYVVDFYNMPLKDAIDYAEFLVDLTIKYQRFADNVATCGGPIDILVITKDGASFIKHKIYKP